VFDDVAGVVWLSLLVIVAVEQQLVRAEWEVGGEVRRQDAPGVVGGEERDVGGRVGELRGLLSTGV
jgi:hypothetical protein